MHVAAEKIKDKIVIKAVRNVRRGYQDEQSSRGMCRPEIKLKASTVPLPYRGVQGNRRTAHGIGSPHRYLPPCTSWAGMFLATFEPRFVPFPFLYGSGEITHAQQLPGLPAS
jgi:hypothetical protein